MEERPPSEPRTDGADLDELVFDCLERVERDGREAVEELCAAHPAQAERLRARLRALESSGLFTLSPSSADGLPDRIGGARLLERLGSGWSGVVYRAEECASGRELALKIPWPFLLADRAVRLRFRRSMELARGLRHANLAPIHAVGESGGVSFVALDYVRSPSLERVLAQIGRRSPETLSSVDWCRCASVAGPDLERTSWIRTCLGIVHALATSLEAAHAARLAHGRLRPWNVVVAPEGRVVLLDLGFGSLGRGSAEGALRREQHDSSYTAPESRRARAGAATPAADVWALGALLHELTTLRLPGELAAGGRRAPMQHRNADVAEPLETVALQALERTPELRYADAGALARDLERLMAGRPVVARRIGWPARTRRACRRVVRTVLRRPAAGPEDPS